MEKKTIPPVLLKVDWSMSVPRGDLFRLFQLYRFYAFRNPFLILKFGVARNTL